MLCVQTIDITPSDDTPDEDKDDGDGFTLTAAGDDVVYALTPTAASASVAAASVASASAANSNGRRVEESVNIDRLRSSFLCSSFAGRGPSSYARYRMPAVYNLVTSVVWTHVSIEHVVVYTHKAGMIDASNR
jgi:hypothetical protein